MKNILDRIDENTFFISDLHLGHNKITQFEPSRKEAYENAGYNNHEDWLIDNWNNTVGENDLVICLGDFAFKGVEPYSNRLNGEKVLIIGNHDKHPSNKSYESWTIIDGIYVHGDMSAKLLGYDYDAWLSALLIDINDTRYMLSHYPVYDENQYDRKNPKIVPRMNTLEEIYEYFECDFSIHGHTHSKVSSYKNSINVCAEHLDFTPKRLKAILKGLK